MTLSMALLVQQIVLFVAVFEVLADVGGEALGVVDGNAVAVLAHHRFLEGFLLLQH